MVLVWNVVGFVQFCIFLVWLAFSLLCSTAALSIDPSIVKASYSQFAIKDDNLTASLLHYTMNGLATVASSIHLRYTMLYNPTSSLQYGLNSADLTPISTRTSAL